MEESREESLVHVQRPNEISHSLSISKNPMKRRRCREDSSVAWYNLDKTKPVKEYRCTEFDAYRRRKADSSKYFHLMKDLKHRRQEKAIGSDSEFEVQEQDKQLQSSGSDSSASDSEDSDSDQVSRLSVGVKTKKLKLNGELKTHNDQKMDIKKDQNRDKMEYLDSEANIYQGGAMETSLFDVQVAVRASYRAENVPFVCLTSQLNGQAILGYPVEIQEVKNDTWRPKKESGGARRFPRLVWKTAKRTPVCYVTNSISSIMPAGENENLNQGKEAKCRSCCVPVELIFSKILAAVGQS